MRKTRKKVWFLFWVVIFIFPALVTFTTAWSAPPKKIGAAELEERVKFYRKIKKLKVAFKQVKRLKDDDLRVKSEGVLTLVGGDQAIWEIVKPSYTKIAITPATIQITTKDMGGKESTETLNVASDLPKRSVVAIATLTTWLRFDVRRLTKEYEIESIATDSFRFVPKLGDDFLFKEIVVTLSKNNHLKKLLFTERSDDSIVIEFAEPNEIIEG